MDGYSDHPSEFEPVAAAEVAPAADVAAAIGSDERRMHVRAYNYWVSLLDGRDFPSIEDLEPGSVEDFAANSVLLDFTCGGDDPATPYIGTAIREECGLGDAIRTIADVPSRSLLSRLTDHYMQIIANRAPVGFEAEFVNQRGDPIRYRGILMPFSSDGDTIDFIYGVINWKQAAPAADMPFVPHLGSQDEPQGEEPLHLDSRLIAGIAPDRVEPTDGGEPVVPFAADEGTDEQAAAVELDEPAGLADRLWAARETAEAARAADGRSRAALYGALGQAYDFAIAARANPADYAELLEDSGVKAQPRAPMTPIVKLVFGVDYDKARLTEFAAALCFAERKQVAAGAFQALLDAQPGGLKALVAAERAARRPGGRGPDARSERALGRLRSAAPIALSGLCGEAEFSLVIARRLPAGGYEAVATVGDEKMVERAIRSAA